MELEYKFYLPEDLSIDEILNASIWKEFSTESWTKHHFVAKYYDSQDLRLSDALIALRVRDEDKNYVMTIKTPSEAKDALSLRNEWNFEWEDKKPSLDFLKEKLRDDLTKDQYVILDSLTDEELICNMSTDVYRYINTLKLGDSTIEAALDKGFLKGGNNKDKVYELEIELKDGEAKDLDKLNGKLNGIFPLQAGVKSKMERCLDLLKQG